MMNFKEILEKIKGSEDFSDLKSSTVRDFLNGNIFIKKIFQKQYGLLLWIALLTFLYIGNRYAYEKQLDRYTNMCEQAENLKYESLTVSAELTKMSRQSNIRSSIIGTELKESKTPAIILEKR